MERRKGGALCIDSVPMKPLVELSGFRGALGVQGRLVDS